MACEEPAAAGRGAGELFLVDFLESDIEASSVRDVSLSQLSRSPDALINCNYS